MTKTTGEAKLLIDLDDYVTEIDPEFELVGNGDIERIASVLGQSGQNNIIYTGQSGVGKTATLLGIAQRKRMAIDNPDKATETGIPLHMVDRRFMLLDLNVLFDHDEPDTIARDIKLIFTELDKPGNYVLVIEDANDLLQGIIDHQCHGLIANFMKELKRNRFQTIWMVREEPAKGKLDAVLHCHAEVRELFTILEKKEPEREEILTILKARRRRMEKHYQGLEITDAALEDTLTLSLQYPSLALWTRQQPARSITFLDRAASTFVSRGQTRPPQLQGLEEQLTQVTGQLVTGQGTTALQARKQELEEQIAALQVTWKKQAQQLYQVQALLRDHQNKLETAERQLAKYRDELREKLIAAKRAKSEPLEVTDFDMDQTKTAEMRATEHDLRLIHDNLRKILAKAAELKRAVNQHLTLDKKDVQQIFSELSGIAADDLNPDETEKILQLERTIQQKVYGQEAAVALVAGTIVAAKAGMKSSKVPLGSFLCLGSSGVGKSYLAEVLAEALFGTKAALTVFDMSEFMEKHKVSQLIGAPPGYAGFGQGGRLTNAVRERPSQALLFDEVEKAHPDVFQILLQVLSEGRLSDELGTVHLNKTAIFLTTNIAQRLAIAGTLNPATPEGRDAIMKELLAFFPQELLNRMDEFLLFNTLTPAHITRIITRDIQELNEGENLKEKGMTIRLGDDDIQRIVTDKYRVEEGARQVQKFVQNRMGGKLAPVILQNRGRPGTIIVAYKPQADGFAFDFVPSQDGMVRDQGATETIARLAHAVPKTAPDM